MTEALSPSLASPTMAHHMHNTTSTTTGSTSTTSDADSRHSVSPKAFAREPRPQARERIPSYAQNRMSAYSQRTSRSRPHSHAFPPLSSSLSYTFVRDFAYPHYHPMHYGPPPESPSGATTPGSDWNPGRRASDVAEVVGMGNGHHFGPAWTAGPWGGDGGAIVYDGPEEADDGRHPRPPSHPPLLPQEMESLPSTRFADGGGSAEYVGEDHRCARSGGGNVVGTSRHRKSKSYANISDFERGRRRESGHGGGGGGGGGGERNRDTTDIFYFSGSGGSGGGQPFSDPAGRESLRLSRGYASGVVVPTTTSSTHPLPASENGAIPRSPRHDSRHDTTLPAHSFHPPSTSSASHAPGSTPSDLPLDAEYPTGHHSHYYYSSPQRESLGPEDEELFAGPSLALYNFEPENPNELRLVEGQTILVSYRHGQGWLVAEDPSTGEQGLVPEEYVRLLRDIEGWDDERGGFVEDEEGEGEEEDEEEEGEKEDDEEEGEEEEDDGEEGDEEDDSRTQVRDVRIGNGIAGTGDGRDRDGDGLGVHATRSVARDTVDRLATRAEGLAVREGRA